MTLDTRCQISSQLQDHRPSFAVRVPSTVVSIIFDAHTVAARHPWGIFQSDVKTPDTALFSHMIVRCPLPYAAVIAFRCCSHTSLHTQGHRLGFTMLKRTMICQTPKK
jgi:hypothetical protein